MRRRIRHWVWPAVGLLGSYVGAVVLLFVLHLHRMGLSQPMQALPTLEPPEPPQRVMVIAPHPDDETLGCGGLIYESVRRGIPVYLVFLTLGDGHPASAALLARGKPSEADYIQLGKLRQKEALQAAARLGVPAEHVIFLGYPDRGLWALWQSHQDHHQPFRSRYTGQVHSPYEHTYHAQAIYSGDSLIEDLGRLFSLYQPTDLYVTHPLDDHADHMAAAAFVTASYLRAKMEKGREGLRLHYYLIHRGDWPLPQGYYPYADLLPPPGIKEPLVAWKRLILSEEALSAKKEALQQYASQRSVMNRFLVSFLRQNELFVSAPWVQPLPSRQITVNRQVEDWHGLAPIHDNPSNDDPVRHLQSGADIVRLWAASKNNQLACLVQMRGPITPQIEVRFYLCVVTRQGRVLTSRWSSFAWQPRKQHDWKLASKRDLLEAQIPIPIRHWQSLALMVETRSMGVRVDHTGYLWLTPDLASPQVSHIP